MKVYPVAHTLRFGNETPQMNNKVSKALSYINIQNTGYAALGLTGVSMAAIILNQRALHRWTAVGAVVAMIAHFGLSQAYKYNKSSSQ